MENGTGPLAATQPVPSQVEVGSCSPLEGRLPLALPTPLACRRSHGPGCGCGREGEDFLVAEIPSRQNQQHAWDTWTQAGWKVNYVGDPFLPSVGKSRGSDSG